MIILGIDPGLATTGYGAVECSRSAPAVIKYGFIRTSPEVHISGRLYQIHADLNSLIHSLHPDLVAVENVYSLVRFPRAGMLLGSVLGIIYLAVYQNSIPVVEITPKEVKNSLAGSGSANKQQLSTAVRKLLGITELKSLHASDALAIALTAFYRKSLKGKR
jgi:crossover junction endodeoxyribonuclease RuvC